MGKVVSIVVLVALLAMVALPAFAQTPETSAPGSAELLTGAGAAIGTWGLWGFIIAVMLTGLAFLIVRGILRPARR